MSPKPQPDLAREAADPATTPARLADLLSTHTEQALRNPALALLLVEQPDFWAKLGVQARKKVARSPECPLSFAAWALVHERSSWMLGVLMKNAKLPAAVRRQAFLQKPARPSDWPGERTALVDVLTLAELALLDRCGAGSAKPTAAPVSADELEVLGELGFLGLKLALLQPRVPSAFLERAWRFDFEGREWVLRRPEAPPDLLTQALTSPIPLLRQLAASHPSLPAAQYEVAAKDDIARVSLALNPSLPAAWFQRLVADPSRHVRANLALHPSLPVALHEALARDMDACTSLRQQKALSPEILALISDTEANREDLLARAGPMSR